MEKICKPSIGDCHSSASQENRTQDSEICLQEVYWEVLSGPILVRGEGEKVGWTQKI